MNDRVDYQNNIELLSHTDQGGRPDGVQVMVHKDHAFVGHMFSHGFTVLDVKDPREPRPVNHVGAVEDTWNIHLQTHGDLLFVVSEAELFFPEKYERPDSPFEAGMRIYDISNPADPREVSFFPVDGLGVHRIWYDGGRYAYLSVLLHGYSGHHLMIVDVADPAKPTEVGRWWIPGMWTGGGEEPTWPSERNYSLHHALVADGIAYAVWRDGGFTLLDVKDPANPSLLAHRNWSPPYDGNTHNPLPLPDKGIAIVLDEVAKPDCIDYEKFIWVVDVREPTNPVNVARFPVPSDADYCAKGGKFGPHNLWENREGNFQSSDIIFAPYNNAGLRVYDISNHYRPQEIAAFVPKGPERMVDPRPGQPQVNQSCDAFVDRNGIVYLTDYNAGLHILEYKG